MTTKKKRPVTKKKRPVTKKKRPVTKKKRPVTKKRTIARTIERRTEATKHGSAAFGARFVRSGFAFTPALDLNFALGYPHYMEFFDDHPADADPTSRARFVSEVGLRHLRPLPRGIALRAVRFLSTMSTSKMLLDAMGGSVEGLGDDEAAALAAQHFGGLDGELALYLIEGLVGPLAPCKAVLDLLAKRGDSMLANDSAVLGSAIYALGYLIRRLPDAVAEAAYAQLESLYESFAMDEEDPYSRPAPVRYLDVVLHGAAGSARGGHRSQEGKTSYFFLGHVLDDPNYVERVMSDTFRPLADDEPDSRRAFLGGEIVLSRELAVWKRYQAKGAHGRMIERFGSIRSERVLPMLLEMSAKSKARSDAFAWFATHREFAEPFLARQMDCGGTNAAWAKDVLARLKKQS